MKSFTDIEQSKKLAEILPLESADMHYVLIDTDENKYDIGIGNYIGVLPCYPAWSLSALFDAMPPIQELCSSTDHYYRVQCMNLFSEWHDNAVDTCYEMILRLHKKGLL